MSEPIGCSGCKYADWDADGCTCKISGLLVPDSRKGCEQRKPAVELKPCPFCGNTDKLGVQSKTTRRIWDVAENDCIYWERFSVRCPRCRARGPVVSGIVGYGAPMMINYNGQQAEIQTREHYAVLARKAWNRMADNE